MSAGITQLLSIGRQDTYITGDPTVSFFRSVYNKHTNFAHGVYRQVIQGIPAAGAMSLVRFDRKGDMLGYVYFTKQASGTSSTVDSWNGDEIDYVELLVGGTVIDRQDSNFSMNIAEIIMSSTQNRTTHTSDKFYRLHFYFCESWASAFPLVAMQFSDLEIRIKWKNPGTDIYECWCQYISLDNDERAYLSSEKRKEFLFYQVQTQPITNGSSVQNLVFNQPVKFVATTGDLLTSATNTARIKLQLNGVDVGEDRPYAPHFTDVPNYYHVPNNNSFSGFLLPFCLETNKFQPTGSLNWSRLDSARLVCTNGETFKSTAPTGSGSGYNAGSDTLYAVNYNVLIIENGQGGAMYAN